MKAIASLGKPVVLVLLNGSALAVNWADKYVPAIVEAWYPGQAAGQAIADVLFGDYNPGGRLPVTFYKSDNQLPAFKDYRLRGRTYRYFEGEPLYAFGFGLSYTRFEYSNLVVPRAVKLNEPIPVSVDVQNTGNRAGEEVIQLYVSDVEATVPVPIRSLQGFQKVWLNPGEKQAIKFLLAPEQVSLIDKELKRAVEPGVFEVFVGGTQPGFRGRPGIPASQVLKARFEVVS